MYYGQDSAPLFSLSGTTYSGPKAQAWALNEDGTQNSPGNPAKAGSSLTIYLTGYGNIPGLPENGQLPEGETSVTPPDVYLMGTSSSDHSPEVKSSSLSPSEPGVWKVKFTVPAVRTSGNYAVAVLYKNLGQTVNSQLGIRLTDWEDPWLDPKYKLTYGPAIVYPLVSIKY